MPSIQQLLALYILIIYRRLNNKYVTNSKVYVIIRIHGGVGWLTFHSRAHSMMGGSIWTGGGG